jgi:asparagine synthase (glutamine-hydrolysing)
LKKPACAFAYPDWLNRDFEARLNLPERWNQLLAEKPHVHPRRPEAYRILTELFWTKLFEAYDPEMTNFPIETRHPLFDLRLLSYLMALPTLPVCVDKRLMRMAMRGMLPELILRRPKAPLAADPTSGRLQNCGRPPWQSFAPLKTLSQYVDLSRYVKSDLAVGAQPWRNSDLARLVMRPISLNYWLRWLEST